MQGIRNGLLSPGIRLLSRINFSKKLMWIALAFVAPLGIALTYLFIEQYQQIQATQLEQEGLRYIKPVLTYVRLTQDISPLGSAQLHEQQSKVETAFKEVVNAHEHFPLQGELVSEFAALKNAIGAPHGDLATVSPEGEFTRRAHVIDAALILVREISDRSQLTLDPGLQTYHMISLAVLHGPLQMEDVAQLRGVGTLALRSGNMSRDRYNAIRDANAAFEVYDRYVENAYAEGVKPFPELVKQVDMAGADAAAQAFRTAVEQQFLQSTLGTENAERFWQLGSIALDRMFQMNERVLVSLDKHLENRLASLWAALLMQIGSAFVFLLIAAYLAVCFRRAVVGGLLQVSDHLANITQGNLTTQIQPDGADEFAQLMTDLRDMQSSMRGMVYRIRQASDEIVHTSSEIASGAMDLSMRTEQTAANLEESASSMEEMSSTVKNTAEHTQRASEVARHNAEVASHGGQAMQEVVQTMDGIRSSSDRISDIISTIDAIAFQTNILALNAAVEAARAGESGRGFAVVATEVRTLAQRSAGAAREIKVLIGSSVEQVEIGTNVVKRAGTTIDQIIESSRQVDQLLGEIATSAQEQAQGVAQIGQAVNELDRMTQQNAALVEQTAAAAAAMKDQASSLMDTISSYQVPDNDAAASTPMATFVDFDDFDFDKAIESHRHWKVKLRQAIAGRDRLDVQTICRDDACALGQWIHGPGGTLWGERPTFVELMQRHADFHVSAGEVAQQINNGAYESAEGLIGSGSRFAAVSSEVATLLTRAKRGL